MDRPPLEVADLVRAAGDAFIERSRKWITWKHVKVLLAIARCRTAMLGGHLDECTRCGHRAISYNSCRNRHCPKCQTGARERWLEKRRSELLPTQYVHVVFTLPRQLAPLTLQNKKVVYDLLFRNTARSCPRSPTSWRRNWLLQRAALLESETRPSPTCALRGAGRWTFCRSLALDQPTLCVLSSCQGAQPSLSRQVRRGTPARFSGRQPQFSRRLATPDSAENLCCVAETTISKGLGGLRETTVRRPGACTPLSWPLHPSCSHLQPSTDLVF